MRGFDQGLSPGAPLGSWLVASAATRGQILMKMYKRGKLASNTLSRNLLQFILSNQYIESGVLPLLFKVVTGTGRAF